MLCSLMPWCLLGIFYFMQLYSGVGVTGKTSILQWSLYELGSWHLEISQNTKCPTLAYFKTWYRPYRYSDSAGKPKKCHCKRLSLYLITFSKRSSFLGSRFVTLTCVTVTDRSCISLKSIYLLTDAIFFKFLWPLMTPCLTPLPSPPTALSPDATEEDLGAIV